MITYYITADGPAIGDIVQLVGENSADREGKVEDVTVDNAVLWIAATADFPRTAFLRQDGRKVYTNR
ncbi:hypothetical protein AU252_13890 [Pseudarthrobacter sulfonivorans]|uniref:Uncharacterized protein n=1 Tax=Pseudarthrobacter sulfonivorans TaxID=121292 RepID=A0A0U3NZ20_9MICC|nr:hypothetical protein [Pseudarthrobacter sulfonivorans]ALV42111.1 hypothetical protein AU252_13890 [Pseudarthrobacter sulfonivorans]